MSTTRQRAVPALLGITTCLVLIGWLRLGMPGPAFFFPTTAAPSVQLAAISGDEPIQVPRPKRATFLLFWAST